MQQTIKHHLTDALLIAYSAGSLPEAFSLAVATHISMCDECRARMESFDTLGGALIEGCDEAPLDEGSLDATMALIMGATQTETQPAEDVGASDISDLPAPLRDYVGCDLESVKWRPVGMGVKQAILPTSGDATARLIYIPAGGAVPDHGHRGTEITLVLQGAFADEIDRFGPGDIEVADEDTHHTPIAEIDADCICLAVTEAPLRFNSLIPRLAQPFLRI